MTLASIETGTGLQRALAQSPTDVVDVVDRSGIRGRGGAGFPTGRKWRLAADSPAPDGRRYVVCNADEGEPGTFKDRVLLADLPDLVLEGMTIAGYAIGATEGVVYLRGEYCYLRDGLVERIGARRAAGLLGNGVRPGFDFEIRLQLGSGAYVCGEETALLESLEGRRGQPRSRPPYPVTSGLHGAPTVVDNVETFAWVTAILAKGADWFSAVGTDRSTGPKLLSVSGDVARPGVYEFPLGVPIADVLAAAGGTDARAVVVGGAAGQCVPASLFGRTISFEDVSTGGAFIVIGPDRVLLDVAENIMEFFADESCGQCAPCRIGTVTILDGIRRLREGRCTPEHLERLVRLAGTMQVTSLCGLGQSSPDVFLSLLEHFPQDMRVPASPGLPAQLVPAGGGE
ncbi:complex I 51 kDa subunit family protein [Cellulomonas humilata]|uniref:[NiFe] hydrogenase diaphorase moiety large subunit n=1 Tax=Cellulomonas humilata TaxID=144055 RepID=A0ABU0EH55_9CELL|nr:NADH-ubiquinone oxidoreductase-F iron-sulfur binding region domain-containing protein [Cellulomonas humilata]MDQ0374609.1 [NiFe] hydrogenase diaphorase moiety large subunit [Cellulomonas humilata]